MEEVHALLDQAAAAFHAARGEDHPDKAAQFDVGIARAAAAVDEFIHYQTNVKPFEAKEV